MRPSRQGTLRYVNDIGGKAFVSLVEGSLLTLRVFRRLISEVLGKDAGDKVPSVMVVMIIWQFRDDPQVVKFMTRFVGKVRQQ
jgi:hypothetical protein